MIIVGFTWPKENIATIAFKAKILIASLDKHLFTRYLDEPELLFARAIAFGNIDLIRTACPPHLSIPALSTSREAIVVVRHTPFVEVECKQSNLGASRRSSMATYICVLGVLPAKSNPSASRA